MATMTYTTKQINREFKIKVAGYNNDTKKLNTLVGVSGLVNLIGVELANKLVKRAFENSLWDDKTVCKLRRGLKVTFYTY